jgi:hypothetical protein
MQNHEERVLTEQNIKLKVSDSVDDAVPDLTQLPPDSQPNEQGAAAVSARAAGAQPSERKEDGRHVDEQKVVELLKNPESDGFLSAIEELSPDEIGRILHTMNEENHWYTQCFRQLTDVPDEPRNALSIIAWWESRRIVFNLLVGVAGIPTVAILGFFMSASLYWIMEGVIAYAVAANVCYTAGCVSELVARHWWAEKAKHFGPILLTLGLTFSIFITLLAIVYMPLVSLGGRWLFG